MSNYDNEGYIGYFQRGFTSNDINIENGLYINNNFTVAEDMLIYGTTYLQPPSDISVNIVNLYVTGSVTSGFTSTTEYWSRYPAPLGNDIKNDNKQ